MVYLITVFQAAQDRDGVLDGGLVHQHWLEPPFKGGVLLDVLSILVDSGGADAVQLSPGQHGFEQVAGVHRAFGLAGSDHRVQLIDKKDDVSARFLHFLENRLQTLFEFAPILGSRDQSAHVEGHDAALLDTFGHIPAHDALSQSFHDGGLPHARIADQDRVVLGAPGENLNHPADLFVPANHRVQLALFRLLSQIPAVAFQGFVNRFRALASHSMAAPHFLQRLQKSLASHSEFLEKEPGDSTVLSSGQQDVFHRHVIIPQASWLAPEPEATTD